jgi:hypothetical protein
MFRIMALGAAGTIIAAWVAQKLRIRVPGL